MEMQFFNPRPRVIEDTCKSILGTEIYRNIVGYVMRITPTGLSRNDTYELVSYILNHLSYIDGNVIVCYYVYKFNINTIMRMLNLPVDMFPSCLHDAWCHIVPLIKPAKSNIIMNRSVDELSYMIDSPIRRCLQDRDINTIGQLVETFANNSIMNVRGIGPIRAARLYRSLLWYGVSPMDISISRELERWMAGSNNRRGYYK